MEKGEINEMAASSQDAAISLEYSHRHPINQPIHHACTHTIHDYWSGDGERWERRQRRMKRPERVAAVGKGRRRTVDEDIRRAPQQGNIFAPTSSTNPSAGVKLGRSFFVKLVQILSILLK